MKKLLKWLSGVVGIYVVFVVIFETVYLGYMQPSFEEGGIPMLDIVTNDDSGNLNKRRLARFESSEGHLYVSAHHWTRGWYHELVTNPEVSVEIDGAKRAFGGPILVFEPSRELSFSNNWDCRWTFPRLTTTN